ncbi:MAG: MFS transporter, partial [Chloroflexi bacterium]|nr:MFS transporter [Chloroflexota bacterium]
LVSNVGTWMQGVGAAWLMTSLTPSPLLVALMQTATSLPIFLVGLPAGALADVVDRRKLLLVTQAWMLLAALALGLLTRAGLVSAWSLLALTFLLGLGGALSAPAWQAIIPDLVEHRELRSAVALNAMGFNVSRAAGPALGGFVVAAAGAATAFLLNAASFLGVLVVIHRWRQARVESGAPPEDMLGATVAGMRYVRHAPPLQAALVRIGVFILGASALWALLPVVARRELGLDATGYGVVLGSLGLGAVGSALLLPRLGRSLSVDRLTAVATLVFAGATLALAELRVLPLVVASMLAGGMAWMAMMSSLTVAAQMASPAWVRARALGIFLLVFQGMQAAGSIGWGALAQRLGDGGSLSCAAAVLVLGLVATWRWPLHVTEGLDLTPSQHWADPQIVMTPEPEDGPVLVTVEYRVPAERASEFVRAMEAMHRFRRKDGAVRWGLYRDMADPDRYLETFVVASWAEHLRQHARVTVDDQAIEAHAFSFQQPGIQPVAHHLIAARAVDGGSSMAPPGAELPSISRFAHEVRRACRRFDRHGGAVWQSEVVPQAAVLKLVEELLHILGAGARHDQDDVVRVHHDQVPHADGRDQPIAGGEQAVVGVERGVPAGNGVAVLVVLHHVVERGPVADVAPAEVHRQGHDVGHLLHDGVVDGDVRDLLVGLLQCGPAAALAGRREPLVGLRELLTERVQEFARAPDEHAGVPDVVSGLEVLPRRLRVRLFDESANLMRLQAVTPGQLGAQLDVAVAGLRMAGRHADVHHAMLHGQVVGKVERLVERLGFEDDMVGGEDGEDRVAVLPGDAEGRQGDGRGGVAPDRLADDVLRR